MKTLPGALQASFDAGETLCRLVKVTLADGSVVRLADHDIDVTIGAETFAASLGFEVSSIAVSSGTQNSSLSLTMLLDDTGVTRAKIQSGKLDRAKVEVSVVDYAALGNGVGLYYLGYVSSTTFTDDVFAELQVTSVLDQNYQSASDLFTYTCRADLGDALCKVDLEPLKKTFTVTEALNTQAFATDLADDDAAWNGGVVTFTSGACVGFSVEVGQYLTAGGSIVVRLPFPHGLAEGDTGIIYPGCDKTPKTCVKYANIANYRGFPIGTDPNAIKDGTTLPTTINDDVPIGEQPPGKIGLYDTRDKSFKWIDATLTPETLPALPDIEEIKGPFIDYFLSYQYVTVREGPLHGVPSGITADDVKNGRYNTFYPVDDALFYGAAFRFNGYVVAADLPSTFSGSAG